jgi:hypothetical protein
MCNKFVSLAIQWEDATPVTATGETCYVCVVDCMFSNACGL